MCWKYVACLIFVVFDEYESFLTAKFPELQYSCLFRVWHVCAWSVHLYVVSVTTWTQPCGCGHLCVCVCVCVYVCVCDWACSNYLLWLLFTVEIFYEKYVHILGQLQKYFYPENFPIYNIYLFLVLSIFLLSFSTDPHLSESFKPLQLLLNEYVSFLVEQVRSDLTENQYRRMLLNCSSK